MTATSDAIILALEQQVSCYRRLVKLAELQHEHVQHGRTEQLLEVLGLRQEVLEQLSEFERVIAPAKQNWAAYLAELDPTGRAGADGLLAETRSLLEQITSADRNDALVLQQRKLDLGRQINQAASARQVNRNYAAAAYGPRTSRMDVQR